MKVYILYSDTVNGSVFQFVVVDIDFFVGKLATAAIQPSNFIFCRYDLVSVIILNSYSIPTLVYQFRNSI